MNRKDDLMKHSSGERTDSEADLLKNSFILFFLFFSPLTFSQIPINGFCSQKNYPLAKGYEGILSSDLDSDGNEELIFYSSTIKRIGMYSGVLTDSSLFKEFSLNIEISQLKEVQRRSGNANIFAAIDRKHRKISLIDISTDSIKSLNSQIEFDSYPENILSGDLNMDGEQEILVYGTGFDGLSILSISNNGFGEQKIINGTSFSDAVVVDYNDDGFQDVVAFNVLENSLQFFSNNTKGIFRLNRSIEYSEKISLLKTHDLNNDGLTDLIYASSNIIEILFGDFQGIFKTKKTIKLDDKPIGIIFGDFNEDKYPDISYSLKKGSLNIIFAKRNSDFYESTTYLNNSTDFSITDFQYSGRDNIACFLKSGEIEVITLVKELNQEMKLVPAVQAGVVTIFHYGKDSNSNIAFVDEYDKNLKLFLVNKSGIPLSLYYLPLAEDHKEIVVDDFYDQIKTFYCYTKGDPFLEVFKYNFKTTELDRKQLYAPGEILDLNLQRIDSSVVNVFLVYNKQSKLYFGKFENRDLSITFKEFPFIDRNVSLANIRIQNEPEIFYWKSESDSFYFKTAKIENGRYNYFTYFKIPNSDSLNINLFGADFNYNNYPEIISIVQNESAKYLLLISGNKFNLSNQLFNNQATSIKKFGRGFFGEMTLKGIINFSVNTIDDNYIYTLIYIEKEKGYKLSNTIAANNVFDYFFMRTDKKNNFLVYSSTKGELLLTSVKK